MKQEQNYKLKQELQLRRLRVVSAFQELKVSNYVPEVVAYFPEYSEKKDQLRKIMRGAVTENDEMAIIAMEETVEKLRAYYKRLSDNQPNNEDIKSMLKKNFI
jgi:hypothetical protein